MDKTHTYTHCSSSCYAACRNSHIPDPHPNRNNQTVAPQPPTNTAAACRAMCVCSSGSSTCSTCRTHAAVRASAASDISLQQQQRQQQHLRRHRNTHAESMLLSTQALPLISIKTRVPLNHIECTHHPLAVMRCITSQVPDPASK